MRYRIKTLTFEDKGDGDGLPLVELDQYRVVAVLDHNQVRINPDKHYVRVLVEQV